MIYFFDNELNIVKVTTSKNVISAVHEHELNGLILGTVEADLSYTEAFIDDVDYFGYYYKDNYYLHKIKRVEHEHENELIRITGRHIFFEDMLYGDYIRDVRPENRDALYILNQTISANTRWQTVMTDTSKVHTTNYYWVPPMEVLNDLTENVGIEYEPRILFDGQNINGFQLHVANRIGEDTPIRVPFGSRVINLKYEVDYSEIVTALYGHGKGEEVGDGYGRRINFRDVNFSRNGVVSPAGQLYMENPNVTAQYGKDDGSPKFGRIVFEDIEDPQELAEATYEAYLEQSRPKMLFEASVVDLGDVGMGDGVLIIRREYDVYFTARIHKLMVDLLDAENADVELGDYAHFKESKVQRKTRENNNQFRRVTSNRIQQLKEQFNARFDGEVAQMWEDYEQALIDAHAEIEAAEVRMTTKINAERDALSDKIDADIAQARSDAEDEYARIESEISGAIDSTREEMEMNFSQQVQDTREYAESQAQARADAVQSNLDTVTSSHQSMLDDLEQSVLSIDDFIGSDRNLGLGEMLYNERMHMEERINSINTWHYNLMRETQTLHPDFWEANNGEIVRDGAESYFVKTGTANISTLRSRQAMYFEAGETYTLTFEVRTFGHRRMDYIWILNRDESVATGNYNITARADEQNALLIYFGSEYRRYFVTFTMEYDFFGVIQIGGNAVNNEIGHSEYRIKKPYLTQSDNRQWLYHPEDSLQNLEEINRRVTQLEDGREEFITRAQYDFETGEIEGELRHILETVDESSNTIANHEDWFMTNGTNVLQTVEDVMSRAWLADIHNPNMIPHSRFNRSNNIAYWDNWKAPLLTQYGDEWLRVRNMSARSDLGVISPAVPDRIIAGETYTISWEAFFNLSESRISSAFDYMYVMYSEESNRGIGTPRIVGTKNETVEGVSRTLYEYELTFTAHHTDDSAAILFGTTCQTGQDNWFFMRHPKLELGDRATPYHNAHSMFSQRADSIALQVDDQESRIANFTVDLEGIRGRVGNIEDDYVTQSSLEITPDYAQIGSIRIDGDTVGSLLRVSPSGIDAVAEAMRLSGDLFVKGDVQAYAMEAVEGEFARLWADEFEAITISVEDINGITAYFENLMVEDANVERLLATSIFADEVSGRIGNYIEGNFGRLWAAEFEAITITADHIDTDTLEFSMFKGIDGLIDRLVVRRAFINEMDALTLNAVYADLRSVNSEIMGTNILKADWIQGGNALLDKVFANTAMFERMMAKSGFVRTLNTVTIDTDQLTIRRPDGVAWVSNGMAQFDIPVQVQEYMDTSVEWTGQRYVTNSRGAQKCAILYTTHAGRYLRVGLTTGMRYDAQHASTHMGIVIRPENSPSGTNWQPMIEEKIVYRSGNDYKIYEIDLGKPTFAAASFSLEFYRIGDNVENPVTLRIHRAWITG